MGSMDPVNRICSCCGIPFPDRLGGLFGWCQDCHDKTRGDKKRECEHPREMDYREILDAIKDLQDIDLERKQILGKLRDHLAANLVQRRIYPGSGSN